MRRLVVVLALGAVLGLGAGVPAASAQTVGYPGYGYSGYAGYGGDPGVSGLAYPGASYGYAGGYSGVGPLAIPGPYPSGPYGAGGYGGVPGYAGVPYGSFPAYAAPIVSGLYNATGYPTFGLFPYQAQSGGVANSGAYSYNNPYAFFLGCTSTYTASSFYVCH